MLQPLTLEVALDAAGRLCARHRAAILRTWSTIEDWAHSRVEVNGLAYALIVEGRPVALVGIVFEGKEAMLWIAGCEGWERHVRRVLRIWREVLASAQELGLERFRCRVDEADAKAKHFVEHLGFAPSPAANGFVPYQRAA